MKSFRLKICLLMLPIALLTSCSEEENRIYPKVNLTFSFALKEGSTIDAKLIHNYSALISIEMGDDNLVVDQQEVSIQKDAEGYTTAPVELPEGTYRLIDFMVLGQEGEVLYATPRQGSELSKRVLRSLPYSFAVNPKEIFDNRIEVLEAHEETAARFGYKSFRRGLHSIKLEVFTTNNSKLTRTSAEALIMKGLDTLRTYRLSPKMNTISFSGNPAETYTLVVVRDSYSRYSQEFTMQRLKGKPLKIILQPALTVVAVPIPQENYFAMQIDPAWGIFEYMIDWGDGTNESWTSGVDVAIEHRYQQPGHYFISITGHGLDSLVLVGNLTGAGEIQRLGLEHIVNLSDFRIEYAQTPKVIDLSDNHNLREIRIYPRPGQESQLEELMIADDASIVDIMIGQNINLKPESLNEFIRDLHHQVINHPQPGSFWYGLYYDENTPMVEPSAEALAKLRDLKNSYRWSIAPDPDVHQ